MNDVGLGTYARRRIRRSSEGNNVLFAHVVQQFACGTTDKRNRSRWQDSGFDDVFHHFVSEPGCRRGGLHENGNAGEKRGGGFFAKAPSGKIERVDEHRRSSRGNEKMLSGEYTGF